ncbi:LysR family transcriptional regulator [Streptomyces coffeae]|uniref:LysR family transcriptional regulator n=1 Tax=Streptomyces coffeae TaxID=621382 RepID=A0ABS1NRU2_9ACTN|nr:LysR family transcriptional regulator [Streptomyces coffeae]MBL1102660.1 LysR family transcriptional regulator [Streptomyces coffeae]
MSTGNSTDPSVQQLKLFLILAEELHFGRAAARLFMSQPAFSQQIRALERRLGLQLVERTTRVVELTPSGQALLPQARAVADAMASLRQAAEVQSREISGRLVIGILTAESAMPHTRAIIDELHTRRPHLTIEMRSLNFVNQYEALARGEVDVAFLLPPVPPGIGSQYLAEEPRIVCLPADDPLAAHDRITLDQLSAHTMPTMPPESPQVWRDFWAINPRPNGTPVRFGPLAVDIEGVLALIARGQTIGMLPASTRDYYPRPGIQYRDLVDASSCTLALTWFSKNHNRPDVTLIRNIARTVLRASGTASGNRPTSR